MQTRDSAFSPFVSFRLASCTRAAKAANHSRALRRSHCRYTLTLTCTCAAARKMRISRIPLKLKKKSNILRRERRRSPPSAVCSRRVCRSATTVTKRRLASRCRAEGCAQQSITYSACSPSLRTQSLVLRYERYATTPFFMTANGARRDARRVFTTNVRAA